MYKRHPSDDPEYRRWKRAVKLLASGKGHILCLECLNPLRCIGTHLSRVHQMTSDQYLVKHGVPYGTVLAPEDLRSIWSAQVRAREQKHVITRAEALLGSIAAAEVVRSCARPRSARQVEAFKKVRFQW